MDEMSRGVIIGRFNPPHSGHVYLIEFAQARVDELYIFICTLPRDEIAGELRFSWMQELFPNVRLIHISEENPLASREKPGALKIWAETVLRELPDKQPDYLFASEDYGPAFARELGAEFVPVDLDRHAHPISSSAIRDNFLNLFACWSFIPPPIRAWFFRKLKSIDAADNRQPINKPDSNKPSNSKPSSSKPGRGRGRGVKE